MTLKHHQDLVGHTDRIWTLAWNPNGTILASSGTDKTIRLWCKEGQVWNCSAVLVETHSKTIRYLSWSPCGNYLASASFDSTICIWKRGAQDGQWSTVGNLEGHESEVKCVDWSHDGRFLASCGRDKTVWIWEKAVDDDEDTDCPENWDCSDVKNDHTMDVKHIKWHPEHDVLVSCGYDDTVRIYHKEDDEWACYQTLSSHESTVWSVDFSANGEYLVTCSDDKTVRVWRNTAHQDLPNVKQNSWKCVSTLQGYHNRVIYDVSYNKINDIIVSASGDNSLVVYKKELDEINNVQDCFVCVDKYHEAHNCDINTIEWNPKIEGLLASAGDDSIIKIWTYSIDELGINQNKKSYKVVDEILSKLLDGESSKTATSNSEELNEEYNLNITDYSFLLKSIQTMQELKLEVDKDSEDHYISKLFNLDINYKDHEWLEVSSIQHNQEGKTEKLSIRIKSKGSTLHYYNVGFILSNKEFQLFLPRRTTSITSFLGKLFLTDKTGDLFSLEPDGQTKFLLGHLFSFSDVKFVKKQREDEIKYIISADRDEKIRISKYPNTHSIERYCFGHTSHVRKLLIVNNEKFLSIDKLDTIILWDLNRLNDGHLLACKPLYPLSTKKLEEVSSKRVKLCH